MSEPRMPRDEVMLLADVAQMYYRDELSQEQIAQLTGVSRSSISRLLKEARGRGIVEIRVHHPFQTVPRLEDELRAALGLAACRVLAVGSDNAAVAVAGDVATRVGAVAARYLQEHVSDNSVIGIGWGSMVHNVVRSGYFARKRGMTVVQIQGGVGGATQDIDGARIVATLARALGARAAYLNAPLVVADTAVRTGLLRDPHIRQTLEVGRQAETLLVGVGSVSPQSGLYRAGYLNDTDLAFILGEGAVGDICGHYFRRDGSPCPLEIDGRSVSLSADSMRRAPRRIGVSCGAAKALSNIGAARSGLINVLVTDEHAAEEMLALIHDEI